MIRPAATADIATCIAIRGRTRENAVSAARLAELGITEQSWSAQVRDEALLGHVVDVDDRVVAYCFGSPSTGEIVVLAVLPECEGRGTGKAVLAATMAALHARGQRRLFLGCSADPRHRSHGFYRHLGWRPTGLRDALGDDVLEYDMRDAPPVAHPESHE